jgi:hypothetical protein
VTVASRFRWRLESCLLCGLLLCLVSVPACGYRLGGKPCDATAQVRRVAVPLFQNKSYIPRAEDFFTRAFRERLQLLPCYRLRPDDEAEAFLKGTILSVESFPTAVDQQFLALEYRMRIVLSVSLETRGDGQVLWRVDKVEGETHFYASSDPLLFQENSSEALKTLAAQMSERILDQLSLGF